MKKLILFVALFFPFRLDAAYSYYRTITLEADQVPSTQTGFTVLVCANSTSPCDASVAGLNQSGGGAHVTQADADDLVFGTNNTCSSLLNWEIELYTAATGALVAWVEIPSLDGSTDTTIYMCYGDSGVTTFQGGSTGAAWDGDTIFVLHFSEASGTTISDFSANGNNFTKNADGQPAVLSGGKFNGGESYNSANDHASRSGIATGTTFTFSGWIQPRTQDHTYGAIFTAAGTTGFYLNQAGGNHKLNYYYSGDHLSTTTITNAAWSHVAVSVSSGDLTFYLNGASDGTAASVPSANITITGFSGAEYLMAYLDEWRLSDVARSGDWISTEYNNQSAPGTFVVFGAETASGGGCSGGLTLLGVGGC